MPFCWEEDPRAEAEGVVLAVDVTCHARRAGLESPTFVSRGLWVRSIGAGPGQTRRLVELLAAASDQMQNPVQPSGDGTTLVFGLETRGGAVANVVSVFDAKQSGVTLMLWSEFALRPAARMVRVRVVATDDIRLQG